MLYKLGHFPGGKKSLISMELMTKPRYSMDWAGCKPDFFPVEPRCWSSQRVESLSLTMPS